MKEYIDLKRDLAHILIVDDERYNRRLLEVMLSPEGFHLKTATNGEEALVMIADEPPDLVLLDVMMPGMDGYQVATRIKGNPLTKSIPIIMLTALGDHDSRMRGLTAGAEDFLTKPVNRAELCVRVRNLLRLKAYSDYQDRYNQMLEGEVGTRTADLMESEARFRQMAGAIKEVYFLIKPDMAEMYYISPAYEEIWGASCESVYAQPRSWSEAIHPEDMALALKEMAPDGVLIPFDVEFRIIHTNGSIRSIRSRAFPIHSDEGAIHRLAGIAEDITEQKQMGVQLRQVQKMESIGRLSGGIAHDFNNLLTVILGHVAILEMCETSADAKESIAQIKSAGERSTNLTRQLLLFARRDAMLKKTMDLNQVIAEISKMLVRILGEDIDFDFRPCTEPLNVQADGGMIDQILMNLAVNARDAMPHGGRLVVETASIELSGQPKRSGKFAVLTVSDSGTGIPPQFLEKIFEPFFTTKEPGKGTGLGLATVSGIVQQHHGWIEVKSEPGQGSVFTVYFPVDKMEVQAVKIAIPVSGVGGTETILIVEDDEALCSLIKDYLGRFGYAVLFATNASDALRIFAKHRKEIALLLTDIVMPGGMSGVELAGLLLKEKPELGVIYCSGYSEVLKAQDLLLKEGANFLAKPYAMPRLTEIVRFQLNLHLPGEKK